MLKLIARKLSNPSGQTARNRRNAQADLRALSHHMLRDIGMGS